MAQKLVLIIAKESNVREVLHACLRDLAHWQVLSVASARCGYEQMIINQPDAILLDSFSLGQSHGWIQQWQQPLQPDPVMVVRQRSEGESKEIQALQRYACRAQIPIVLLTPGAHWLSLAQLQEIGVIGAISKPFDPVTLPLEFSATLGWGK
jgi:CheY-like chemotaxis protein